MRCCSRRNLGVVLVLLLVGIPISRLLYELLFVEEGETTGRVYVPSMNDPVRATHLHILENLTPVEHQMSQTRKQNINGSENVLVDEKPNIHVSPIETTSAVFCNNQNSFHEDIEGEVPVAFELNHVVVVTRHGDRSSMYSLPGVANPKLSCLLHGDNGSLVHTFITAMDNIVQNDPQNRIFRYFQAYPNSSSCTSSQLTAIGAEQMLKIGSHLRKRYIVTSKLFEASDVIPVESIHIWTTEYDRTFQSAVAFLYAFLPRVDIRKIKFHLATNVFFCTQSSLSNVTCGCRLSGRIRRGIDRKHKMCPDLKEIEHNVRRNIAELLGVTTSALPWTFSILEVLATHVCHGLGLPCVANGCFTQRTIDLLQAAVDQSCEILNDDVKQELSSRLDTHPMLFSILNRLLQSAQMNNRSLGLFTLYSGHDLTLSGLLNALGIHDGQRPVYASRLVFELYRRVLDNKFYIRIIYNGRDRTHLLRFCRDTGDLVDGVCMLDRFSHFVLVDNFRMFNSFHSNVGACIKNS